MTEKQITLSLKKLELQLNIGVPDEERRAKQTIYIGFNIYFPAIPSGAITDELLGTVCYDSLSTEIRKFCEGAEFKLIEHLAYSLHQYLKSKIPSDLRLEIIVEKPNAPVKGLLGGVSVTYAD